MTDEQLVQAMSRGEQAAFEAFVLRYHGPVLGYLERMLQDPGKAEDLTQETFVRLISQLKRGKLPDQIKPWMYRVATNLCKDYWKSAGFRRDVKTSGEVPEQIDGRASVIDIYERQETRKELLHTLEEIPPVQKEIILLRFYQDMKLQDIADTLEMTLSGVKTHLYNGLRKLKSKLEKQHAPTKVKEGSTRDRS